ncbi:hypothetical protein [Priestia megaterium]|uniref:hypothetical protein n=1 Tax=Priestia megaterium TaxID=1404 RepID=UPI003CC5E5D1
MSFTLSTNAMYIDSKFNQVKEKLKEVFTVIEEYDSFLILEVKESRIVLYDNYQVFFEKANISLEEFDFVAKTLEDIIKEVLIGFKFKTPKELMEYRIENILRRYGKIKGVTRLVFSDRQCIKDLMEVID